jgi:hypothetical protein
MSQVVAVDLDGTLAKYSGNYVKGEIGAPVKPMVLRVKSWIKQGKRVKIFTSRAHDKTEIPRIQDWLEENGLPRLDVTNIKLPEFSEFYDDRAYHVVPNTGKVIGATNP